MAGIISYMDLLCSVSGCLLNKTHEKPLKITLIASVNLNVCLSKAFDLTLIDSIRPMFILLTNLPYFDLVPQVPL